MRYRKLTATGDYSFGHSLSDFYIDQAECVSQSVQTRLQLNQGDWFLNTQAGVPWNTKVLGKSSAITRDTIIKSVISGTNGFVAFEKTIGGTIAYSTTLVNRRLTIYASITTIYTQTPIPVQAVI